MNVIIFDTETNGLIPRNTTYHNSNAFPYILQLSYIVYNDKNNKITTIEDNVIKIPKNVEISQQITNINNIDKNICETKGINIKDVLEKFIYNLSNSNVIVAHNYNFDKIMILAELKRNNMLTSQIQQKLLQGYCTMENGTNLCKIPRAYHTYNNSSFKYPKLVELYNHLFIKNDKNPLFLDETKLHNSLCDVIVTSRCYFKMNYNIDIYEKSQDYKGLFNELVYLC